MSSLSSAALRPAQPGYEEYPLSPLETPRRGPAWSASPRSVNRRRTERAPRRGMRWSLLVCGLLIGSAAAAFAASLHQGFLLGQIAVVVVAAAALHGLWRGGLRKGVMLALLAAWASAAAYLPGVALSLLKQTTGGASQTAAYLVVGAVGLTAYLLVGKAVKSFRRRVIEPRRWLRAADRSTGLLVGAAEGALIMLVICWTALSLQPQTRQLRHHGALASFPMVESWIGGLEQVAAEAGREPWGRTITANNPLRDLFAKQQWFAGPVTGDTAQRRPQAGAEVSSKAPSSARQFLQSANPDQVRQVLDQYNASAQTRNDQVRLLQEKLRASRGRK